MPGEYSFNRIKCPIGSYFKAVEGSLHRIYTAFDVSEYSVPDTRILVKDGFLSDAVKKKEVIDFFIVDEKTIETHDWGLLTEDSVFERWKNVNGL